jgi:hypothetical protein
MASKREKIGCLRTRIITDNVLDFSFWILQKKYFRVDLFRQAKFVFSIREVWLNIFNCALKRVETIKLEFFNYQTVFKNWLFLTLARYQQNLCLWLLARFDISKLNRLESTIFLFYKLVLAKIMDVFIIKCIKN